MFVELGNIKYFKFTNVLSVTIYIRKRLKTTFVITSNAIQSDFKRKHLHCKLITQHTNTEKMFEFLKTALTTYLNQLIQNSKFCRSYYFY